MTRADPLLTMKPPVVLVTVSLAVAILLTASLLIVTGSRGETVLGPLSGVVHGGSRPFVENKERTEANQRKAQAVVPAQRLLQIQD
jgi:hypothetical protein